MTKRLLKKLSDIFRPKEILDVDVFEVLEALGDQVTRKHWLFEILSEIKKINLDIDKKLLSGSGLNELVMKDLSSRRRALQFVLETALEAKREVQRQRGHNRATKGEFDLESVTLQPGL